MEIEIESIRVIARVNNIAITPSNAKSKAYQPSPEKLLKNKAGVYRWEKLNPGARIVGPALVVSGNSTTFVDNGWDWILDVHQNALMTRKEQLTEKHASHSEAAQLELFTNRFTAIAYDMGAMLQRTSFSVNVKGLRYSIP